MGSVAVIARIALPVIVPRAVVLGVLLRLMIGALPLAMGGAFDPLSTPPAAVVMVTGIVGIVDVNVRGERLLWANLGARRLVLGALYALAAVPAELVLLVARG